MLRRLIYPHSLIVTCLMFVLIWVLDIIRINLHFLNPFNETIRDYEITDIVYSRLRDEKTKFDDRIVLVNTGRPNRDTLRMVVDRMVDAGARVIAIDVMLSEQKNHYSDSLLRRSLQRIENTVLAIELSGYNLETDKLEYQTGCDTFFCDYVYSGYINFVVSDTGSTVRYFSPRQKNDDGDYLAFSTLTAKLFDPKAAERLFKRNKEVEEIYYFGNEAQFFQYESKDILDPDATDIVNKRVRDKIVLIGFLGNYAYDDDRHYTPLNYHYTARNTPDMYGVVIHANIIRMILDCSYVRELSPWANLMLTFVFCYFNIHLYYEVFRRVSLPYQFITRFLQLGEIILLFFVVAFLFHFYRIKMDVAYWITALLLTFDAVKFYDNGIRKRIPLLNRIPYALPSMSKTPKREKKPIEKPAEEHVVATPPPVKTETKK